MDPLFYDSHIHLVDEYYANFLTQILTSMRELRIKACSVTMDISTSRRAIDLFRDANRDVVYNFVGIHPEFAQIEEFSEFEDLVAQNRNLIDGIGEIGLDHSYDTSENYIYSKQLDIFKKMLNIAEEIERPVSIHSRGTLDEILDLIPSYDHLVVCLHWFDGTEKQLQRSMDMGLFVSYGPLIAYSRNKKKLLGLADRNKILIETDGPVRYSGCFKNVTSLPTNMLITILNIMSHELKMTFEEAMYLVSTNSHMFFNG